MKLILMALLLAAAPIVAQQKPATPDKPVAIQHKDKDGKPELYFTDLQKSQMQAIQANLDAIQARSELQSEREKNPYNQMTSRIIEQVLAANPDYTWHNPESANDPPGYVLKSVDDARKRSKDLTPPMQPPPPAATAQPAPGPVVKAPAAPPPPEPAKK